MLARGNLFVIVTLLASMASLLANLGTMVYVIFELRGLEAVDCSHNRPFIAGWRYDDLRPIMIV